LLGRSKPSSSAVSKSRYRVNFISDA
jgi:hypothetical protein